MQWSACKNIQRRTRKAMRADKQPQRQRLRGRAGLYIHTYEVIREVETGQEQDLAETN